jgi:hypothetical protein
MVVAGGLDVDADTDTIKSKTHVSTDSPPVSLKSRDLIFRHGEKRYLD